MKIRMMVFLAKATGRIAEVFRPIRPSASQSMDSPAPKAMRRQIGVLMDNGMHIIIAGRMDKVIRGVNWK
jgi:hypothetical protein